MPYRLTYSDLPVEIDHWPGYPWLLSGHQVVPLAAQAEDMGWLLYGRGLNKYGLAEFQHQLGIPMVVVKAWCIEDYQVVCVAGHLPVRADTVADKLGFDVASLEGHPSLTRPGLLVMDMDSTAIEIECIDEIARLAGVGEWVSAITERAMRGELDFSTSLRQRVATLRGADAGILTQVRDTLPLMPGLVELVGDLHLAGWHVAIASGGFTYYADYLRDRFQLTAAVANQLEVKAGRLTGEVLAPIVDAEYKASTLVKLAETLDIPLDQTVALGDGANDLAMIKTAGLGIAYRAKPNVFAQAKVAIRHADLTGVRCILSRSLKHEEY